MRHSKLVLGTLLAAAVLSGVTVALARQWRPTAFAPPPEVQYQSFSISNGSVITASNVHPADVLGVGVYPLIICDNLGLLCADPVTGAADDIRGLSYGADFIEGNLPPFQFSVSAGSRGLAGTAVRAEADCSPAEPQADVFETALDGQNYQDLDGNGTACSSNDGFGLDLNEGAVGDNLDEIGRDPCASVDANCDGEPEEPVFVTLAPGSPTLSAMNAASSDILLLGSQIEPSVFASGVIDLGLQAGDVIDALCVRENGNGLNDNGDLIMFSLAAGSPSLTSWQAGAADVLTPRNLFRYRASMLGLQTTDDIDGLQCSLEMNLYNLWLPVIFRSS
jgi:hypothetical protein